MAEAPYRIVIDTNTVLRGLVGVTSAAAKLLRAAESREVLPLLSKAVMDEYRAVLSDGALRGRFPSLDPVFVELTLRRRRYVGEYVRSPKVRFLYRRDPKDQKFIELALALTATHIVSADKDLLSLPSARDDAGRRFRQRLPRVEVLSAGDFVAKHLD